MIVQLSWKNVWRNRTRSMVVICAIVLGTIVGVFVAGLMNGWSAQKVHDTIYTSESHLKIRNPEFLKDQNVGDTISGYGAVLNSLRQQQSVKAFSPRVRVNSMATTSRGATGVTLVGIDVEKEKQVSDVYHRLIANGGTYFENTFRLPSIVISEKTAEHLKVKYYQLKSKSLDSLLERGVQKETVESLRRLEGKKFYTKKTFRKALKSVLDIESLDRKGAVIKELATVVKLKSKIVTTFTRADGEIGYQSYQVCGVYRTVNAMFDNQNAFVLQKGLTGAVGIEANTFHELAVVLDDDADDLLTDTSRNLAIEFPDNNVMTWKQMAPDASFMADFMGIYYYIIMGIIFFALAFGIINTMLMSILERVKELGMLMAIGMNRQKIFKMIVMETIFLTLTGAVVGMALGGVLIAITNKTGLNFSSAQEGFEAIGWSSVVHPSIEFHFFIGTTLLVILVGILASIVPARRALNLNPVEAIREQ